MVKVLLWQSDVDAVDIDAPFGTVSGALPSTPPLFAGTASPFAPSAVATAAALIVTPDVVQFAAVAAPNDSPVTVTANEFGLSNVMVTLPLPPGCSVAVVEATVAVTASVLGRDVNVADAPSAWPVVDQYA